MDREDRLHGALLGVAIGDAVGLPFEGLSARRIGRSRIDRFRLVGRTGFVSDDTEQSALLAQCLAMGTDDACVRRFRRSMVGWLARLPFGVGFATLRACLRMALGFRRTGISSAGNGAAMRAGILGVHLASDPARRRELGRAIASLTHADPRAIEAALYVAEVAAAASSADPRCERAALIDRARHVVVEPQLNAAIDAALSLVRSDTPLDVAVARLGNTGFAVHTVGLCTYLLVRDGDTPMRAIEAAIRAGGDTDTHAAILGGWTGVLHGARSLPTELIDALHDGPFGPTHLRALADALANDAPPPRWSPLYALLRNLALYPVVLAHGFARLVPWWAP